MGKFAVEVSEQSGATVVALIGMADLTAADQIDHKLTLVLAQKPQRVVVDLSQLAGISSICMGSLVRLKRGLDPSPNSKRVILAGPQELVLLALRRARLDEFFPIYPTLEQALDPA
jgi:anti-anti-sigma factor